MNPFEELLGNLKAHAEQTKILPEAAIARLVEALPRFQSENPFKPGDLVTIRKDAPLKSAGKPCVVVEVGDRLNTSSPDCGDWADGVNFNVRVISIQELPLGEFIAPNVIPHWALEYYGGDGAKAETPLN